MDILNEQENTYICEGCEDIVDLVTSAEWERDSEIFSFDIPCLCKTCLDGCIEYVKNDMDVDFDGVELSKLH